MANSWRGSPSSLQILARCRSSPEEVPSFKASANVPAEQEQGTNIDAEENQAGWAEFALEEVGTQGETRREQERSMARGKGDWPGRWHALGFSGHSWQWRVRKKGDLSRSQRTGRVGREARGRGWNQRNQPALEIPCKAQALHWGCSPLASHLHLTGASLSDTERVGGNAAQWGEHCFVKATVMPEASSPGP